MTTLFHFAAPVKTTRKFGAGLLRSLPTYQAPYSQADLDWLAENSNRPTTPARSNLDTMGPAVFGIRQAPTPTPLRFYEPTAAELAYEATLAAARRRQVDAELDRQVDQMAAEAEAIALMEAGLAAW